MSKYASITRHLQSIDSDTWMPEFSEIETILGMPLPRSAHEYAAWWSNQGSGSHSQSRAWQDVGWRTANLDLDNQRVTFVRDRPRSVENRTMAGDGTKSMVTARDELAEKGISIAEAKAGLSIYFGIPPENIEITIRG